MIPIFPEHRFLKLTDKEIVQQYLILQPYSDYNFLSLWSNNIDENVIISSLYDNLILRLYDYTTHQPFYSFIGQNKTKETIETLLNLSKHENIPEILKLIPESSITTNIPTEFITEEDRDNFDYILSVEELSELYGNKYHNQRNFIHKFTALYPQCVAKSIDLKNDTVKTEVLKIFKLWAEAKHNQKTDMDSDTEYNALQRTISYSSYFNLISIGIFDNSELIGFIIGDLEHPEYCQTHFAKVNPRYQGGFYYLYSSIAKELKKLGFRYINIEQDLGIFGLRFSKEQWNPVKFLKKFTIRRK